MTMRELIVHMWRMQTCNEHAWVADDAIPSAMLAPMHIAWVGDLLDRKARYCTHTRKQHFYYRVSQLGQLLLTGDQKWNGSV